VQVTNTPSARRGTPVCTWTWFWSRLGSQFRSRFWVRFVSLFVSSLAVVSAGNAQTVETTTSSPRTVTLRVIHIETDVENPWDRWWARRVAFELAEAEFQLATLRTRRPADQADRDRIRTRLREVQGEVSRLRTLAAASERQVRSGQVVVHGWDGVNARQVTVIAERARADEAARLNAGELVDFTIESVSRTIPHPNPRTGSEHHRTSRPLEHYVRQLRGRADTPPDWRAPQDASRLRYPPVAIEPKSVTVTLEQRRSSIQRPYLVVKATSGGWANSVRWVRVRAFAPAADGNGEIELTPAEGMLISTPRVEVVHRSTTFAAERAVDWPPELADSVRFEVLEAWRYQSG